MGDKPFPMCAVESIGWTSVNGSRSRVTLVPTAGQRRELTNYYRNDRPLTRIDVPTGSARV